MTKLLKKALERVSGLPENEQDAIASIILEELEDVRLLGTLENLFKNSMDAIGRIGSDAGVPYLVKGLTSSDHYVRWQAAKGLARFPGGDATAALTEALRDRHPLVRDRVAASLMRHGADGKAAVEGWKPGRSRKLRKKYKPPVPVPEGDGGVVAETDLVKESGFLYYLGKDGDVWRTRMARGTQKGGGGEKVADAGVTREPGWLYYINKEGNVARTLLKRGG